MIRGFGVRVGRLLVVWLVCCGVGLAGSLAAASGSGSSSENSPSAGGVGASSLLGDALVTSGSPVEGEETQAERKAKLDSPEAVRLREESQTKFEGLDPEQAAKLSGEAFPALVNEPVGGPPKLPAGESIAGFSADNAAQVDLSGGKHGVIESIGPMAVETSAGHRVPVDLSLKDAGNAFEPKTPAVGVRIPKRLGEGAQLSGSGVSLTPVTEQGSALGGSEGTLNGATVFYANTQTNTDTLAKPISGGFELDSLLRAVDSSEVLYFEVGMPSGASLVSNAAPDGASVVLNGQTIAVIAVPTAQDAEGTNVPVRMSVSGSMLVLAVPHSSDEYDYPIAVDPRAYDETLKLPGGENDTETNWRYHEEPSGKFKAPYSTGYGYVMSTQGTISEAEHDEFRYGAHGQASVGFLEQESSASATEQSGAITKIEFAHEGVKENELTLAAAGQSYSKVKGGFGDLWNESEKAYRGYNNENLVRIMQTATKSAPEGYGFWFELNTGAWVGIYQEKGPEVSFNTSEATIFIFGPKNVLYGSGGWLGEHNGAFEVIPKDPGLGVSDVKVKDLTAGAHGEHWEFNDPVYADHLCTGVWCNETFQTNGPNGAYFTDSKEMAEGANTFELCAEDEALMKACTDATVKVDNTPPGNIKLKGIAESGAELNAVSHQVTVEATDATSGVKSIAVSLDGKEIGSPTGSCPLGECTASRTVTIDGESLGAGEHKLKVVAIDDAGNEAPPKEYTFAIRNATPVHLGPGSVDPVTGQFALTASDVDIAGAGSLSRTYVSRSLSAGVEGPLGPEWSLNTGSSQSLTLLADGNAELRTPGGGLTTFENEKGRFKAPPGDENLTLEAKEKEAGKGVTEYLLADPAAGSKTIFTRPQETGGFTVPRYFSNTGPEVGGNHIGVDSKGNVWGSASGSIEEFNSNREFVMAFGFGVKDGKEELETCTTSCKSGLSGAQRGEISNTEALAVDTKGNIWAVDGDNRIEEFNEKGAFVAQFAEEKTGPGNYGEGSDEVHNAKGIAVAANGTIWVADTSNRRVDEFNEKREFVGAFGFGVLGGGEKLEVCTTVCRSGVSGSGHGQFAEPEGIAVHNGFVWVADTKNDRVEKFTEKYEYVESFGSSGSGDGQFSRPRHIAADNKGGLWVADGENGRIELFSEAGAYQGQFGATGSENERLYWYDFWLGAGGVAVDSSGNVWVPTYTGVKEWTHSTWTPTRTEGTAPDDTRAASFRSVMVEGKTVTEPIEELGPVPAGVSCGKNPAEVVQAELSVRLAELKAGCRALSFTYAEKTTATGEGSSEWGEYNSRLMKVSFTAYNPAKGIEKMETKVVVEYAYDKLGRLRAEWNPQISPALKTIYGYDTEGHVTALTPPGQESWALTYGTIPSDGSPGRLLKVTRAPASAKLWKGEAPKNTEAPKLSGSAVTGVTMSVSIGTWSNEPAAYAYQWEDCNSEGKECAPILGATNAHHTLTGGDVEHTVVAQVIATNGGGSVSVSTSASASVRPETTEYSLPAGSGPFWIANGPDEHLWFTNYATSKIGKMTATGTITEYSLPTGSAPRGIALGPDGNLWFADLGTSKIGKITTAGTITEYALPAGSEPWGITSGPDGKLWFTNASTSKIGKITTAGAVTEYSLPTGSAPYGITSGPDGNLWFADLGTSKIGRITTAGAIAEYSLPSGSAPFGITSGPDGNLWFADESTSKIGKITTGGTITEYSLPSGSAPRGITSSPDGSLWFADLGTSKIGKITTSGAIAEYSLPAGSEPHGISPGPDRNLWIADLNTNKIGKVIVSPKEGEQGPRQPGSTIEYNVPLWGSGAPYQMTSAELAKWGEKEDLPSEATAIFAPDEPMGWPAIDYKRANIEYMDAEARTVNAASPSGAISTIEYNHLNEVTRTLSADNRATALKEGSKSAEAAEALSTKNIYNSEGTQLLETYGPEHKIRLANGTEEETRDHKKLSYNEEAPSGETYNLVTKTTEWAETTAKEILSKHETFTSYNDQEKLGWTLRKPTLVTSVVEGQTTTKAMSYEKETGNPIEASSSVSTGAPVYAVQFGSAGTGAGQLKSPVSDTLDASGDLWVTDYNNSRVQEFSAAGVFIKAFGWGVSNGKSEFEICTSGCQAGISGSGEGQFSKPATIAINQTTGNVYIVDNGNNRVEEFESSGKFVRKFGEYGSEKGQLNNPLSIAITPTGGEVWVGDAFNQRVDKFSETGTANGSFGKGGTGNGEFNHPDGIAFSAGNVYVADTGNNRVQEFSMSGKYMTQFGSKGTGNDQFEGPYGITVDPVSGDLYVSDYGNDRIEEFTPGRTFRDAFGKKGSGNGELLEPQNVAVNAAGYIYVGDIGNNRIEEWEPIRPAPVYSSQFGSKGTGNGQFNEPRGAAIDPGGHAWVVDTENSRLEKLSPSGSFEAAYGSHGSGTLQFSGAAGIAINQSTGNIYVADRKNMRIEELSSSGAFVRTWGFGVSNGESKFQVCTTGCRGGFEGAGNGEFHTPLGVTIDGSGNVWVADYGNDRVEKFTGTGEFVGAYGTAGTGNGQFTNPEGVAVLGETLYVTDTYNNRVEELSMSGAYVGQFGSYGSGHGQFKRPSYITTDSTGNIYVVDKGNQRVQEFTPSGAFLGTFASAGTGNGQLGSTEDISADGIAVNSSGVVYVVDTANNRVEEWTPAPRPGNEGAHDTKAIFYTAKGEAEVTACQNRPEWAGLVCQTEPIGQPGDSGPPPLPVTSTTYNMWDEPETIAESFPKSGSFAEHTRLTKDEYDAAGRMKSSEETSTSSEEKALPAVTDEYSSETGALVKLTSTIESNARTITSVYNTLGQLTSYTDAEGSTTKYAYDVDGRVEELSEPKGKQIYAYDPTTGFLTKLLDSAAGTFTASYGVSGEMLTEGYPDGMTAKYTYDSIGQATNLEYEKTTHCSEKCVWFSDAVAFGPKGELASQISTLSSESYSYNEAGQLTKTQETPVGGKGCITRLYGYNEASGERESSTMREPNEKGECTIGGGVVEGHFYDAVGRLLDPGVTYDALGNMTKVPALDAGGSAITSSFYVDNQTAVQEQNEKSISYIYDPAGRTMIAKAKTTSGTLTTISHYAGSGNALTWTCEEAGECKEEKETKWTRNIPGIDGALDAIQTNEGTPVLQLHDLQGNIIATAADNETETKLLTTHNSTEFGVPIGTAPKYSWLGADGAQSELGTGVISEAGATYVPQLARTLQTEQIIPPGAAANGVMDTESYHPPELSWANQSGNEAAANTVAEQRTLEVEACEANPLSCGTLTDPAPFVLHLTQIEAYEMANNIFGLLQVERETNIAAPFVDPSGTIDSAIVELLFPNDTKAWDEYLANALHACLIFLGTWEGIAEGEPGCRVSEPTVTWSPIGHFCIKSFCSPSYTVTDVRRDPEISACISGTYVGTQRQYTLQNCMLVE